MPKKSEKWPKMGFFAKSEKFVFLTKIFCVLLRVASEAPEIFGDAHNVGVLNTFTLSNRTARATVRS